jgi:hypothetical protein
MVMVIVMVRATAAPNYAYSLRQSAGMARAESLVMTITSSSVGRLIVDITDARNNSLCETCWSPVELTASVLLKGSRIVGCPTCDWGATRTVRAASVPRVVTEAFPICALG